MARINVSDLGKEIARALTNYTDDVVEEMRAAQDELSKEGVKMLKNINIQRTGEYKKGWRRMKTKKGYVIHNKHRYRLTHLLEKGHEARDGSYVKARPHIKQVEEKVVGEFIRRVEKAIQS